MMFATLDDLEGSVEILVFEQGAGGVRGRARRRRDRLVRGRVDHKDADKTCLVVQDVDPFEPTDEEIERAKAQVAKQAAAVPQALERQIDGQLPATVIDDLRELIERYPGESEIVLEIAHAHGRAPAQAAARPTASRRATPDCAPSSTRSWASRPPSRPRPRR